MAGIALSVSEREEISPSGVLGRVIRRHCPSVGQTDQHGESRGQPQRWTSSGEMGRHLEFSIATGCPIYFCDPRSPRQRPTNENTNGLLRQYFPKSTDLTGVTAAHLDTVADELNGRSARPSTT